jgi:hypothetical protein
MRTREGKDGGKQLGRKSVGNGGEKALAVLVFEHLLVVCTQRSVALPTRDWESGLPSMY